MSGNFKIPTLVDQNLAFVRKNQRFLDQVNVSIASGKQYQDYKGYAEKRNIESLTILSSRMSDIDSFKRANMLAKSELETSNYAISRLQTIASNLSTLLTKRRSATGESVPFNTETTKMLEEIASVLNTRENGNYIFSGSKTNTAPVDTNTIKNSTLDSANNPTDTYYRGDNEESSVRLNDTESLEYGVNANDSAFKNLIGAIHLARAGDTANNFLTLGNAVTLLNDTISDLAAVRSNIRTDSNLISSNQQQLDDLQNLLRKKLTTIQDTDIVEASSHLSELETQMQASFYALTRLSQISLTSFL
jgi:flagellar hook-associated protein 3 FlgL